MTVLLALTSVSAARVGEQAAKTLIIVLFLLVAFRLTGKREVSQFNVYDLAMLILLSNAVQNSMTGGLGNLAVGLATSTTVVAVAWLLSWFIARRAGVETRVLGAPMLLVNHGRVLPERLRRAGVSRDDLDEACRAHGLEAPRDAALVVLEIDGSMSVVSADTPSTRARRPTAPRRITRRRTPGDQNPRDRRTPRTPGAHRRRARRAR
jgi:uncharacterized membrane protein YcaP (DUF421 family)